MTTLSAIVKGVLSAVLSVNLCADIATERFDRELFAVIRWEILWGVLPSSSHVDTSRTTHFAVRWARDEVAYCSHDLGICESYRVGNYRNWEAITAVPCSARGSDEDALRAFHGKPHRLSLSGAPAPYSSADGEFSGRLEESSGVMWTTATRLGTWAEIADRYKVLRPLQLPVLKQWLRTSPHGRHGTEIVVPCFASTDPEVFLSVTMPSGEHHIETVFWNREAAKWESADGFGFAMDARVAGRLRETIDSISCGRVLF